MTINEIKNNVQALLVATDKFATVLPHQPTEDTQFEGYPSAMHYYGNTVSDYATVSQNRRVIEYIVEMYLVIRDPETDESTKMTKSYELMDDIVQMFDETIDLSKGSGIALGLTAACDLMRPVPGEFIPISVAEGKGYMMTIRLFCSADVAFR